NSVCQWSDRSNHRTCFQRTSCGESAKTCAQSGLASGGASIRGSFGLPPGASSDSPCREGGVFEGGEPSRLRNRSSGHATVTKSTDATTTRLATQAHLGFRGVTTIRLSPWETPGPDQAARSASCRSAHERTLPRRMTLLPWTSTLTRRASLAAL